MKVVISDKEDAYALEHARPGYPQSYINPKDFGDRAAFDRAIIEDISHKHKVDFVVLAGYMCAWSARYFIQQYPDKILNIHPSLLPAFKGMHAIKDAFEYGGIKVTGLDRAFCRSKKWTRGRSIILQEARCAVEARGHLGIPEGPKDPPGRTPHLSQSH